MSAERLPTRRLGDSDVEATVLGLGCNNFGGRVDREYVIATKFGMEMRGAEGVPEVPRGSREYVRWAVEGSLRRLRIDRIDLYRGLARYVTLQNEYSLLERGIEAEVAPACERLGVSILPFFPLAMGMLTGKYRRGEPPAAGTRLAARGIEGTGEQFDVVEALEEYAAERGIGVLDVAIAGLASTKWHLHTVPDCSAVT